MRVLLADEHADMRWALRLVLSEEPGLTVVGEICTAETLLGQARLLQPDLILVEWELSGRPVSPLIAALHEQAAQACVVVLSRCPEVAPAAQAARADAFLSLAGSPDQFLAALRELVRETTSWPS
jgi:two-component system nitrate/nitrite response regulator NarL